MHCATMLLFNVREHRRSEPRLTRPVCYGGGVRRGRMSCYDVVPSSNVLCRCVSLGL